MELVNELYASEAELSAGILADLLERFVLLFGPFAPYVAQEMWEVLGNSGPVFRQSWPAYDESLTKEDTAEIVVQVNGKLRSKMNVPFGTTQEAAQAMAMEDPKVQPFAAGKPVVKVIYVPDKLLNIVVKG
jgi:leucyl-tRNA synthetase